MCACTVFVLRLRREAEKSKAPKGLEEDRFTHTAAQHSNHCQNARASRAVRCVGWGLCGGLWTKLPQLASPHKHTYCIDERERVCVCE